MVLLQEKHNAVLQRNTLGLLRMEWVQRWNRDLFPRLGLLSWRGGGKNQHCKERSQQSGADQDANLHFWPPSFFGCAVGICVSICALVRLEAANVALATRRMSAFVTLSTRSSC